MKEFRFINEFPASRTDEIAEYLTGPRLWIPRTDYPDVLDWAQKVHTELKAEIKRAMVAYQGGEIVGVTVYQRDKRNPKALEIKNLTVRPDVRGRHVASFLLRNAEIEGAAEFRTEIAICDAKATNIAIKFFLLRQHYQIVDQTDLYGLGAGEDLIFRKSLLTEHIKNSGLMLP